VQYPELSCASYNKNPAALNEPDGIVAVWNMHLLERPEFVFHSQVCPYPLTKTLLRLYCMGAVRCALGHVLALPLKLDLWWHVLGPNPFVGYTFKTPSGAQDAAVRGRTHTPSVWDADGGHAERTQFDHEQYGRNGMQLACGHARAAPGKFCFQSKCTNSVSYRR
jgi:hypothetical protein